MCSTIGAHAKEGKSEKNNQWLNEPTNDFRDLESNHFKIPEVQLLCTTGRPP